MKISFALMMSVGCLCAGGSGLAQTNVPFSTPTATQQVGNGSATVTGYGGTTTITYPAAQTTRHHHRKHPQANVVSTPVPTPMNSGSAKMISGSVKH